MLRSTRAIFVAAGAAAGALALASPGHAAVQLGTLNCTIGSGPGYLIASSRPVACTYSGPAGPEYYTGSMAKLGMDIGWLRGGRMIWDVVTPTAAAAPERGMLSGNYAGVTGSASIGVGGGASLLVGGSGQAFTLQPVSIEALSGVDLAGGLESLSLRYTPPPR